MQIAKILSNLFSLDFGVETLKFFISLVLLRVTASGEQLTPLPNTW